MFFSRCSSLLFFFCCCCCDCFCSIASLAAISSISSGEVGVTTTGVPPGGLTLSANVLKLSSFWLLNPRLLLLSVAFVVGGKPAAFFSTLIQLLRMLIVPVDSTILWLSQVIS
uniref:Putative secreted peptide n=1 Tax=Anopheles braziliensis TaxID=58242 RepID=A0A2M3ZTA6_9DIPT